jgi:hypothetical protein
MASAVFFEEKQRNPPWMGWIVIIAGMGMLGFVLVELLKRWVDPNNPDTSELLVWTPGIIVIVGVIAWLVLSNHLSVSIDKEGISYVFVPTFWKPKRIEADQLESFELRMITFSELTSSGASHDVFKAKRKREVCVIWGSTVADLHLRDGRQVILGTRNPEGMRWALKRLQNQG